MISGSARPGRRSATTCLRCSRIAIPLLGGTERTKYVGAMECGVEQGEQTFEVTGFNPVEVSFVTLDTVT